MDWNSLSNEELLREYQNGEFQAFDHFFKKNHRIILCYILKKGESLESAEDILQDTFFRIHKYILKYDPDRNAINWILSIAQNVFLTRKNKEKFCEELPEDMALEHKDPVETLAEKTQVEQLLQSLHKEERQILVDRLIEEQSFKDIAKNHKISNGTARQRVSRILKKLRAYNPL